MFVICNNMHFAEKQELLDRKVSGTCTYLRSPPTDLMILHFSCLYLST